MFDLQIVFYVKIVNLFDAECSTFSGQLLGDKMESFYIFVLSVELISLKLLN